MSNPKILVVEDDKFLSGVLKDKLSKSGFDVEAAFNGEEAINAIHQHKPDLILLDLVMPVKDGFDCLAEIKKDQEIADIPVIVSTNLSQESDEKKCRDLGAVDYYVKADTPIFEVVEKVKSYIKK